MSVIPRVTQKIFASGASNNGQFGSAQLGTKVLSNDLATVMALSAWEEGWLDATLGAVRFPALEEFQAVEYVHSTQIAYILQQGIAEYDAGTTYYQNCIVKQSGTYKLYGSLTDNNTGNPLTDPTNWKFLQDISKVGGTVFTGSGSSGGSANAQTLTTTGGDFTLVAGNIVDFVAGHTNTGATTFAVDGTTATTIKKQGSSGLIDLAAGDITTSQTYIVVYDGVYFELQSAFNPAAFLQVANNLSDVGNAGTALGNLGGLAKSANLSDVANAATALANLGGIGTLLIASGAVGSWAICSYQQGTSAANPPFVQGTNYSGSSLQTQTPFSGGGQSNFAFNTGTWKCIANTPTSVGGWGGYLNTWLGLFQRVS